MDRREELKSRYERRRRGEKRYDWLDMNHNDKVEDKTRKSRKKKEIGNSLVKETEREREWEREREREREGGGRERERGGRERERERGEEREREREREGGGKKEREREREREIEKERERERERERESKQKEDEQIQSDQIFKENFGVEIRGVQTSFSTHISEQPVTQC